MPTFPILLGWAILMSFIILFYTMLFNKKNSRETFYVGLYLGILYFLHVYKCTLSSRWSSYTIDGL